MGSRIARALRNPGDACAAILSIARGHWYKWWYPLRGIRFRAGRGLRVSGRLRIQGPGTVVFGDNVHIGMTVTPFTYTREAQILVGSGVFLNGTRFGCVDRISIGDDCIVAECRVMDSNFHSLHANRHDSAAPIKQAPVELARNVWIAADSALLPGTRIGRDSVVAIASVCKGQFPAGVIIAGNPASVVGEVPGHVPDGTETLSRVGAVTNVATSATVAR